MKITDIECHILVAPDLREDATSSSQDDLIVLVHTDEGITGIGETDTGPWLGRAAIEAPGSHSMAMGMKDLLIGQDPFDTSALWEMLYTFTCKSGRRGAVICAMGAIDMALWDLKGKALGVPVHSLLGGAVKSHLTPYASLLPTGRTVTDYAESLLDKIQSAKAMGFHAAKVEVCIQGPYAHNGIQESDEAIVEIVGACRQAVGPDFTLMVDVAYCWPDAKAALRVLDRLAPFDLFFMETPLDIDDLEGYAFLADRSPIRIAAGEWQNTHWEFLDLADRGRVDVMQPDIGRVGGFTEARKVAHLAADRGRLIVPHCWKSGIGIAASSHLAAATDCCPYIEFLPAALSESALRRELTIDELEWQADGSLALPAKPGLGVELNRETLERYSVP